MLNDLSGKIWMDGQWVDTCDAKISVMTHSLHYGVGVFEGIRSYPTASTPAIFRLQAHIDRLFRSAQIIGLKIPFSKEELRLAHIDAIKLNNLSHAYLRPIVYTGAEQLGLHTKKLSVHVAIIAWEWGAYLGDESKTKGLKVGTSSYQRHHANSAMTKAKATGNYLNSALAVQEAHRHGYQEAILLDHEGYIAEGSGENIFMVKDNALYTPDTSCILVGITRDTVIQMAKEKGWKVTEKRLSRDEFYTADEAFFTGTAVEIAPICEYDGHSIGNGQPGPVTRDVQQTYDSLIMGKTNPNHEWLTYC